MILKPLCVLEDLEHRNILPIFDASNADCH
jgi:hypothetical protein